MKKFNKLLNETLDEYLPDVQIIEDEPAAEEPQSFEFSSEPAAKVAFLTTVAKDSEVDLNHPKIKKAIEDVKKEEDRKHKKDVREQDRRQNSIHKTIRRLKRVVMDSDLNKADKDMLLNSLNCGDGSESIVKLSKNVEDETK